MSFHERVMRIKGLYYPKVPEEKGVCPACGHTYNQEMSDECPECGYSSYVIFNEPLKELDFS